MKRIVSIAIMVLVLPLLFACGEGGEDESMSNDLFEMKATVNEVGEKIEVDVFEAEYASGIYWVISSELTKLLDKDGNEISKDDIKSGDTVIITYNGQVMMSYPPQVAALSIKKI